MNGILYRLGITGGADNKAAKLFENLSEKGSFLDFGYECPSEYVKYYWEQYLSYKKEKSDSEGKMNNTGGKIFEYTIATLLVRENILPFYSQAKVAFIPNVDYDIVLYSQERGPIALSLKTSLRERYKQADLEAYVLKNVHRKALCYLLTADEKECNTLRKKVNDGDLIGLNDVLYFDTPEFNAFIEELKKYHFLCPEPVAVISAGQRVGAEKLNLFSGEDNSLFGKE